MDAEGPRDGAGCADGRFAELCCADVPRCTRQRLVLPKAARALYTASMLYIHCAQSLCEVGCPCFAREGATEPFWTRGRGGSGLQF